MNIKEFYEKYNLNKTSFAPIAGVGVSTLIKYEKGETIREDARSRIEKAMRVAEKYNLVRPKHSHESVIKKGTSYTDEYYRDVCEYEYKFKQVMRLEL